MIARPLRLPMLTAAILAMSLSACGDGKGAAAGATADAIAKVAAPAGRAWSSVVAKTDDGFVIGNPDAPLKLVEFGSFTCSHCADFSKASAEPLKREFIDTGRVSYELRPFIRDAADLLLARVTTCASADRFFPLAENVFASQAEIFAAAQANPDAMNNLGATPEAARFTTLARGLKLDQFFAARGVPAADLDRCLTDKAALDRLVARTEANAKTYEINGTPTFLLNGAVMEATGTWDAVRAKLVAAGAR